jgi:hypothetical protein
MIDIDKIEAAAKAVKGWSNCNQAWLDTSEDEPAAVVGHISDEGETYPVAVVDCDFYLQGQDSLPLAKFYATANPATVLEMVSMIRERDAVLRQALNEIKQMKTVPPNNEPDDVERGFNAAIGRCAKALESAIERGLS